MINIIWLLLILIGIIGGAMTGNLDNVSEAIFQSTVESVSISLRLLGPIALWLGLMNIARQAGMIDFLAGLIKPVFKYIFPDIVENKRASGAIIMNLTANILGLGNSATPLGIKAMQELQEVNSQKDKASPAMCTLLALNTSGLTIIPATIIGLRAAAGSVNPAIITITTIFSTSFSTITALVLDKTFRYFTVK